MKKFAIGCGIVLLLVGIGAAGAAYYLYNRVASTLTQFAELGQVPELERSVRNKSAFVPPASEELTDSQIEKLLKIQADVRSRIGERMAAFETKYKSLAEKEKATVTDVPALLAAYRDLAATWMERSAARLKRSMPPSCRSKNTGGSAIRRIARLAWLTSTSTSRRSSTRPSAA